MKKEYDLTNLKKRPGKVRVDKSAAKIPVGLRLDGSDLALLKSEAERRGIPYQTLVGSILHQYLNEELIERKTVEVLKKLKVSRAV
jgi:predicted DNA binding CopG/RHH family protein